MTCVSMSWPSADAVDAPKPEADLAFTLPVPIADIAYQNKRLIFVKLFKAAAETTLRIAAR